MMHSILKRACTETRSVTTIPTFLVPAFARLSTTSQTTEHGTAIPHIETSRPQPIRPLKRPSLEPNSSQDALPSITRTTPKTDALSFAHEPFQISSSIRDLLPSLSAQSSHYITVHIHGHPYLVSEGDTVRLPFRMPHVQPGDVIRLNRATNLGSRDFTLKAAANQTQDGETTHGEHEGLNQTTHFVYNRLAGMTRYLDERLFVCRAVVTGTESEPMRIKEKTKRRQRRVKHVKSKHRYTVIRIKDLRVKTLDELDADAEARPLVEDCA